MKAELSCKQKAVLQVRVRRACVKNLVSGSEQGHGPPGWPHLCSRAVSGPPWEQLGLWAA